ncbi:MAG: 3-keto-disaccharide hydrolase [Bacteroidota bacterium]
MKKLMFPLLILLTLSACKTTDPNDPLTLLKEVDPEAINSLSPKEIKDGWTLLSDGTSFIGWHGFNMERIPDCWTIEDGAFTMNTEGGSESQDIVTDQVYSNFALYAEFKLTPGANSGIMFQVAEDTIYHYPYETGPEYQVIDDKGWPDKLENWQTCGANYAMYPPLADANLPVGEWNKAFIVVNGNHVTQFLNGVKTAEYEKYSEEWTQLRNSGKWASFPDYGKYDEGRIALQNHGTRVWFRNIKLKTL